MKKLRFGITLKSIVTTVLLLSFFAGVIGSIGYRAFAAALYEQYTDTAFRIADAAAQTVDGDRIREYWGSQGKSEAYQQVWIRLDQLCNATGATFIYVIQPDLSDYGHITFLFSTVNRHSEYSPYEVGYVRTTTNEEYRIKYHALYAGEAERELLLLQGPGYNPSGYHITAMVPLKGTDQRTNAILCVQLQMEAILEIRHTYIRNTLGVLAVLTVFAVIGMALNINHSLIQPIKKITEEASRFAEENVTLGEKLTDSIKSKDEIGVLAGSVDRMEEQITRYVDNLTRVTAEKERIGAELDIARRLQASMLPSTFPAFPERCDFDIYATMTPAREVGGDFYDFFLIDEDHLALVIADVSGKGVPAALVMTITKKLIKTRVLMGDSPAETLFNVNNQLCDGNKQDMFVTAWLGILELSTGRLNAANAGHEYPAIRRADGRFELLRDKHGFVLGGMPNTAYPEYELQLEPGTKLFVYTDGVPEATDAEQALFGTERMLTALNEASDTTAEQLLKQVQQAVDAFVKQAEQFDDLTMLCLDYRGKEIAPFKRNAYDLCI